jgi:hypothetical protein
MSTQTKPDTFTLAYLECALWSSYDNATEDGGEPMDANYSSRDIAPETLARMAEDCAAFQSDNREDLTAAEITPERAGFLFWLNRNGHGSGFWDEVGGGHELRPIFNRLSDAAKVWGTFDLYLGDDGQIHGT